MSTRETRSSLIKNHARNDIEFSIIQNGRVAGASISAFKAGTDSFAHETDSCCLTFKESRDFFNSLATFFHFDLNALDPPKREI